jgi:hypothetical protein
MRCTLVYNGAGQPDGLRDSVAVKGITFPHGVEVEVSAELAGQVLANSVGFALKAGVPKDYVAQIPSVRAALKALRVRQGVFDGSPKEALSGLPTLPAEALRGTVKQVEEGAMDAHLYGLAVWAKIGGKSDLAEACVLRAEALKQKG